MSNKFENVLDTIGKEFEKGLTEAIKYLPAASFLATLIFPPAVAPLATATSTATLLQNAIAVVEQKYAASGAQSGTGTQKAAEVMTLTESAVTTMLADPGTQKGLAKAGIAVNSTYVNNLISAIVGFLNIQGIAADPSGSPIENPAAA